MHPLMPRRILAFVVIGAPNGPARFRTMARLLRLLCFMGLAHFLLLFFLVLFIADTGGERVWLPIAGYLVLACVSFGLVALGNLAHLRWIDADHRALGSAGLAGAVASVWGILWAVEAVYVAAQLPVEALPFLALFRLPVFAFLGAGVVIIAKALQPAARLELEARRRMQPVFLGSGLPSWSCARCRLAFHAPDGQGSGLCPACRTLHRVGAARA